MSDAQRPSSDSWYKNQLQEYAQKASIGLPTYKTVSEGQPHVPQFRSVVWVDGSCFTSSQTFPNRKTAEQEVAKLALTGIRDKVKNEGSARIYADTVFCKSIISEYAVKMGLGPPAYTTQQTKALLQLFVSTLVLNGVAYVGDVAKNKKEAEQVAARSAILSILASEPGTTMSEIVRSKYKFFDALKNGNMPPDSNFQNGNIPPGPNTLDDGGASLLCNNKWKEVHDSGSPEPLHPTQFPAIVPPPPQSATVLPPPQPVTVPPPPQSATVPPPPQSATVPPPPQSATVLPPPQSATVLPPSQSSTVPPPPQSITIPPPPQSATVPLPHQSVTVPSPPQSTIASLPPQSTIVSPPPQSAFEQHPATQVDIHQPIHEFKRARVETPSEVIELPVVFVPATAVQAVPGATTVQAPESSASVSAQRRKKRKAKKQAQLLPSLPMGIVPP